MQLQRRHAKAARFPSSVILFVTNCANNLFCFEFHQRLRFKKIHAKIFILNSTLFFIVSESNKFVITYMYISLCTCLAWWNDTECLLFFHLARSDTWLERWHLHSSHEISHSSWETRFSSCESGSIHLTSTVYSTAMFEKVMFENRFRMKINYVEGVAWNKFQ